MKNRILVFVCFVFISVSLLIIAPAAEQTITINEAKELIIKMTDFENAVVGDSSISTTGYDLYDLPSTIVTDIDLHRRVREKMGIAETRFEKVEIRRFDGEYGKASYWNEYFKSFFTEQYVEEELKIPRPITQLDGAVYTVEKAFYISTPGLPSLIPEKSVEECITIVDNDTVLFEAFYESYDGQAYVIDFEYTNNGWRISGGEGTEKWMHRINQYGENPETGDSVTPIVMCLLVSSIGISVMLKKRTYGYTV